jgi:amino acid transporter
MAKDGLLFDFLSKINAKSKVPNAATFVSLIICLSLTVLLNIKDLIGFGNLTVL